MDRWNKPEYDKNGNLICYYCRESMLNDFGFVAGEWYCVTPWCKSPSRR